MNRAAIRTSRVLAAMLLACLGFTASAADLKIASVAPDGSHWMQQMRAGAEEIKTRTSGRVVLKFYPGGVMGNDSQVLRKIRANQLQGGAFASGGLAERYSGLNLYGIPLLFRSLAEVDAVRAKLDPKIAAGLEQAGFETFGFVEGGFANLFSNEPIRTVSEMRRKKVWVPDGDQISFLAMQELGLSPVTLPVTDVLTGLQTGLIEITFASPVVALVLQWHTKVKYITRLPVSYSYGIFAIEKEAFGHVSADDQKVVREVMTKTLSGLDHEARAENERANETLLTAGLKPVEVGTADLDTWRHTIEGLYPQLRSRPDVNAELFDELQALLAEYRKAHP
ncbi:MAG TPA: TRAP transporter substrate-binding protein DctP [Gammaproteobacteria bacterium]|nr:TRAP transporter substrate-binding protein DctP [Gammaproteobacteria bacterium]